MLKARPRVLVLAEEKGLAEVILKGLSGIAGLDAEVEVLLEPSAVGRIVVERSYDLAVVGGADGPATDRLVELAPPALPLVAVGGGPNGRDTPRGALARIPLPLSFNLLRAAVLDSLGGRRGIETDAPRRRDSVG